MVIFVLSACKTTTDTNALSGSAAGKNSQRISTKDKLEVPDNFKLELVYLSLNFKFNITSNGKIIGKMSEKVLALNSTFNFYDSEGHYIGKSQRNPLSWGARIDIYDQHDNKIGSVKEIITRSFYKYSTVYSIQDADGKKLGESEKSEIITTSFEVKSDTGEKVMDMKRPLALTEYWNIRLYDKDAVDSRILLSIAAHKSKADYVKRNED